MVRTNTQMTIVGLHREPVPDPSVVRPYQQFSLQRYGLDCAHLDRTTNYKPTWAIIILKYLQLAWVAVYTNQSHLIPRLVSYGSLLLYYL